MDNGTSRAAEVYESALAYWQAETARYRTEAATARASLYTLAEYAADKAAEELADSRYGPSAAYSDMSNRVSAVITEMTGGVNDGE